MTIKEFRYRKNENSRLDQEFGNSDYYGKVRLGEEHLFWKKGLVWYYIGFDKVTRIYRRVEAVDTKMCCGNVNFDIQKLVLILKDGTKLETVIGDGLLKEAQQLFEQLKETKPGISYGKE